MQRNVLRNGQRIQLLPRLTCEELRQGCVGARVPHGLRISVEGQAGGRAQACSEMRLECGRCYPAICTSVNAVACMVASDIALWGRQPPMPGLCQPSSGISQSHLDQAAGTGLSAC